MINSRHRTTLQAALPTFMNTCEGGACGNTGTDAQTPDEFELAALAGLAAIEVIRFARYHASQKRAVLVALRNEIDDQLKFI